MMTKPIAPLVVFDEGNAVADAESMSRAAWPESTTYQDTSDSVRFRETIIDIQGRNGDHRDWLHRRFESRRQGVWRR